MVELKLNIKEKAGETKGKAKEAEGAIKVKLKKQKEL